MSDAPIAYTKSLALGKWGNKKDPGYAALNENWDLVDAAVMMHGTAFPDSYQVSKLFLRSDEGAIYRNDGTEDVPSWTVILSLTSVPESAVIGLEDDLQALSDAIDAEAVLRASGDSAEAVARSDADDAEAAARAAADLLFLKLDGTRAMTGTIDLGNHRATNMSDPVDPKDGVNKETFDAATVAGFDAIHEPVFWMLMG